MSSPFYHPHLSDATGRPLELTPIEDAPVCPVCGRGPTPVRLMKHWTSTARGEVRLQCPNCDHAETRRTR